MSDLLVYRTQKELADAGAQQFATLAETAIAQRGVFNVALAGGNSPRLLYQRLVQPPYLDGLDWLNIQVFFGDERCVPKDHPESNFGMTNEALLAYVPMLANNIHRIPGELSPAQAADTYNAELKKFFSGDLPVFDLILLGLGEDGHTASLFPGSPALQETRRWVVAVDHSTPPPPMLPRVTLTLPVINAARNVLFVVNGAAKTKILAYVLDNQNGSSKLPAQLIQPASGCLSYLADEAAAQNIKSKPY
jgi:6-phosphogluconolactonase